MENDASARLYLIQHHNISHHPLGGGTYIFSEKLIQHLNLRCTKSRIILHRLPAQQLSAHGDYH